MTGLYHGWDGDKDNHADFVHGAVDPDDFEKEMPYRKKRGKAKAKKVGCPDNNGKGHVYVWVDYDSEWLSGYEKKVCCGCGKRSSSRGSVRRKT